MLWKIYVEISIISIVFVYSPKKLNRKNYPKIIIELIARRKKEGKKAINHIGSLLAEIFNDYRFAVIKNVFKKCIRSEAWDKDKIINNNNCPFMLADDSC